jgi:MHS family metabolite:H+ symporter-like MFS transporter
LSSVRHAFYAADVDESAELASKGVTKQDLYRAAWAASLGSTLEYYDFALYNLASALIFGPLFFPSTNPSLGLIASFGTYFIGFAIRPVGGIVFGILGDRLGRKFVLMATVFLMGAASTLIGALPTYATAGIWAPIMLICCDCCKGSELERNRPARRYSWRSTRLAIEGATSRPSRSWASSSGPWLPL